MILQIKFFIIIIKIKLKLYTDVLSKDWWVISMNDATENKIFDNIHSELNDSIKRMK